MLVLVLDLDVGEARGLLVQRLEIRLLVAPAIMQAEQDAGTVVTGPGRDLPEKGEVGVHR